MNIQVDSHGNRRIVRIEGKITFEHCPAFQRRLDTVLVEKGLREVVLDFSRVPFIDSSGVGEVLRLFKRMREMGGEVVLLDPNRKLQELFLMYRLDRFMRICEAKDLDKNETTNH